MKDVILVSNIEGERVRGGEGQKLRKSEDERIGREEMERKKHIRHFRDLEVYRRGFDAAMEIFQMTKKALSCCVQEQNN